VSNDDTDIVGTNEQRRSHVILINHRTGMLAVTHAHMHTGGTHNHHSYNHNANKGLTQAAIVHRSYTRRAAAQTRNGVAVTGAQRDVWQCACAHTHAHPHTPHAHHSKTTQTRALIHTDQSPMQSEMRDKEGRVVTCNDVMVRAPRASHSDSADWAGGSSVQGAGDGDEQKKAAAIAVQRTNLRRGFGEIGLDKLRCGCGVGGGEGLDVAREHSGHASATSEPERASRPQTRQHTATSCALSTACLSVCASLVSSQGAMRHNIHNESSQAPPSSPSRHGCAVRCTPHTQTEIAWPRRARFDSLQGPHATAVSTRTHVDLRCHNPHKHIHTHTHTHTQTDMHALVIGSHPPWRARPSVSSRLCAHAFACLAACQTVARSLARSRWRGASVHSPPSTTGRQLLRTLSTPILNAPVSRLWPGSHLLPRCAGPCAASRHPTCDRCGPVSKTGG
jgi:hypothetical protein